MAASYIAWTLSNFDLLMFILALIFIVFHRLIRKNLAESEIVYRWMALFALGFTALYAFIFHVFFADFSAQAIGWNNTPFQYEVASANFAIASIAILSFNASYGFRLATVIASTCWLWGDAIVHLYEFIAYHNDAVGNIGSWFWMDVFVPIILICCIVKLRPTRK
jgi:hypothetical protein